MAVCSNEADCTYTVVMNIDLESEFISIPFRGLEGKPGFKITLYSSLLLL